MSTLYIEEQTLLDKIAQLREQKTKIDTVLERVKGDTLQIQDYWSGDTGDEVQDEMNKYINKFDFISSKLEKQITTLEETVRKYHNANIATEKQIETNASVSAI